MLVYLPSAPAVFFCWAVGGLLALCGALGYAELGAAMPHSGGEYYFLSRLYHPSVGFVSAWVSLIAGFSAPLAAIALGFGSYLEALVPIPPVVSGGILIAVLSALNAWRVSAGAGFHNLITASKVLFIVGFVAFGAWRADAELLAGARASLGATLWSPGFAVGLLSVVFAYTGWNAAAYVVGEVKNPQRALPLALSLGTLFVTVLYVALNAVFLGAASIDELSGQDAVAEVVARKLFGESGGRIIAGIIALGLVATANAVIVTGPRIYEAVGRDMVKLRWLSARSEQGGPTRAIALQAVLALAMMFAARLEQLLVYIGFTLSVFAALAVFGVYLLRRRRDIELSYRMPGYPVTPALFLALSAWMIVQGLIERPMSALAGVLTMAVGLAIYRLSV
jgi:APA family basic amino acid/polyamine antiporter